MCNWDVTRGLTRMKIRGRKKTIKGNRKVMIGAATGLLSSSSMYQCCSFHHYQIRPCFVTQEDDVFSLAGEDPQEIISALTMDGSNSGIGQ